MSQTWIIKDTAPVDTASRELSAQQCSFTSNGHKFSSISIVEQAEVAVYVLTYDTFEVAGAEGSSNFDWSGNEAYKTLIFDTAPTGELLAWLQKNADEQSDPEYLTRKSELTSIANAIRAKGGTSAPLAYPDGFVTAIQSIDTTGGTKPATLTITSSSYTGNRNARFIFPTLEGRIGDQDFLYETFTFPVTINTVIGGLVVVNPSGFPGYPTWHNPIGSEVSRNSGQFIILVTSPQASIEIINGD